MHVLPYELLESNGPFGGLKLAIPVSSMLKKSRRTPKGYAGLNRSLKSG